MADVESLLLGLCHSEPLYVLDNLLLDHVGLTQVLVHLFNLFVWMGKGDHSKTCKVK